MPGRRALVYFSANDVLNAIPAHAAALSPEGDIRAVNRHWIEFAEENGLSSSDYGVGTNYYELCELVQGPEREQAIQTANAIRQLTRGERHRYTNLYPCHSPSEERWFLLDACAVGDDAPRP